MYGNKIMIDIRKGGKGLSPSKSTKGSGKD